MKNYIIKAFFTIKAESTDEAERIAASMQHAANDVYQSVDRFLLVNENEPITEGEVEIVVREYSK